MSCFQIQKRRPSYCSVRWNWNGDVESLSAAPAGSLRVIVEIRAQPAGMLKPLPAHTACWMLENGEKSRFFAPRVTNRKYRVSTHIVHRLAGKRKLDLRTGIQVRLWRTAEAVHPGWLGRC
jgi:hypothetical protein